MLPDNATWNDVAYEANGNMLGGDDDDRSFTYSVFDQMTTVEKGDNALVLGYGIDRPRNHRREAVDGVATTTFYLGSAERVKWGSTTEVRRRNYATLATLPPYTTEFMSVITRGYTGHEHGDAFEIIHTNGRI